MLQQALKAKSVLHDESKPWRDQVLEARALLDCQFAVKIRLPQRGELTGAASSQASDLVAEWHRFWLNGRLVSVAAICFNQMTSSQETALPVPDFRPQ